MEGDDDDYGEDAYLGGGGAGGDLATDDDLFVQPLFVPPEDSSAAAMFGASATAAIQPAIQNLGVQGLRSFQLPIALHDTMGDNGNEGLGGGGKTHDMHDAVRLFRRCI